MSEVTKIQLALTVLTDPIGAMALTQEDLNLIRSEEAKNEPFNSDKLKKQSALVLNTWIIGIEQRLQNLESRNVSVTI